MDNKEALAIAELKLDLILNNQPELLKKESGVYVTDGANLANFCHDFIEQYAQRLLARKDQQ